MPAQLGALPWTTVAAEGCGPCGRCRRSCCAPLPRQLCCLSSRRAKHHDYRLITSSLGIVQALSALLGMSPMAGGFEQCCFLI
jgi:hypothetical protein